MRDNMRLKQHPWFASTRIAHSTAAPNGAKRGGLPITFHANPVLGAGVAPASFVSSITQTRSREMCVVLAAQPLDKKQYITSTYSRTGRAVS